jgi:hypothetical protein
VDQHAPDDLHRTGEPIDALDVRQIIRADLGFDASPDGVQVVCKCFEVVEVIVLFDWESNHESQRNTFCITSSYKNQFQPWPRRLPADDAFRLHQDLASFAAYV